MACRRTSRTVGILATFGLVLAQPLSAFETELFAVDFPTNPQRFDLPIEDVVAYSYQAETSEPAVSYVVTVTPFADATRDSSLWSFLESELDFANGTLTATTPFQYEALEAIAFEARFSYQTTWILRRGIVIRGLDEFIFVLAQTPEPPLEQFPKIAEAFLESFRLAGMRHLELPADSFEEEIAEEYSTYFGGDWTWRQVKPGQKSLTSDPDYPCQVKAFGWRELGTRRKRSPESPWYSFGDIWANWAWKLVVNANAEGRVYARVDVSLLSDDNFVLSESTKGIDPVVAFQQRDRLSELVILEPNEITALQGTSWFNTAEHEGEGSARGITWRVSCYRAN